MSGPAGKFQTLYDALEKRCGVRPYEGQVEGLAYPALRETSRMAQKVWDRFDRKVLKSA